MPVESPSECPVLTLEQCREIALSYTQLSQFRTKRPQVYRSAKAQGFLDEVTAHLKSRSIWTFEMCQSEASKFSSRSEFREESHHAYNAARKRGWLDKLHPARETKLTKTYCLTVASKYATRSFFAKGDSSAYSYAQQKGWLEECCAHMRRPDRTQIDKSHCLKMAATCFSASLFKLQYPHLYTKAKSDSFTDELVYRVITPDECNSEFLQSLVKNYSSIFSFQCAHPDLYALIVQNEWQSICFAGLPYQKRWDYETCLTEAKKFTTSREFRLNSQTAYLKAYNKGWLREICAHMQSHSEDQEELNFDECKEIALRFKNKTDFRVNGGHVVRTALRNGWFDDICKCFPKASRAKWTIESITALAVNFQSRSEFAKAHISAYSAAVKKNWLDKVFKHLG
jgi:hypothetical protein